MKKHYKAITPLLLAPLCLFGCSKKTKPNYPLSTNIIINVLDVGQGSTTIIQLPNNKLFMIDIGDNKAKFEDEVSKFFKVNNQYSNTIDYLLISHPDQDHINNSDYLFNNYKINYCYMPQVYVQEIISTYTDLDNIKPTMSKNTSIYKKTFSYIIDNNITWEYLDPTDINDIDNVFIYDSKENDWSDWNDFSPIIFINLGNNKYACISNDAETKKEKWYSDTMKKYDCEVYVMGHHGSGTSSTQPFLNMINPQNCIYSAYDLDGKKYGHPNINSLNRVAKYTSNIYGTDQNGSISFEYKTEIIFNKELIKRTNGWTGKGRELVDISF